MKIKEYSKKDLKLFLNKLKEQYGINNKDFLEKLSKEYIFIEKSSKKIYILKKELKNLYKDKIFVNYGLYFCSLEKDGIRLSIEGSQIIGPYATKNIIELSKEDSIRWMSGEDIKVDIKYIPNFVIVKCENGDFMGCGKVKNYKILNYVPKHRRINRQ